MAAGISIVGLFVLGILALLAILLIVFIVKALSKNPGVGRVLVGGFAVVVIWVVGTFLLYQRQTVDSRESLNSIMSYDDRVGVSGGGASIQPQAPMSSGITIAGTPWTNAVEEFQDFEADVYPSIEAAAEALGRRVGTRLMETSSTGNTAKRSIYVWLDEDLGSISRDVLEAVATGIRQKLDNPAYVSVERPASPDAVAVGLAVQEFQFESHKRWRKQTESRSGAIALRVKTPDGPFSVSTRFNEAPWVEDRNAFAAKYSKGDWLVGYSDGTHTTQEQAKRDAILAATETLLPLAKARISQLPASDQHHFTKQMQEDPDWLRDRIADELVAGNMLADRFAQRFDRPYGTVWREAVLIDASPKRIEEIARSLVQGVDSRVASKRGALLSYIAMFGLVLGTYVFLNMATKGYYAGALRFVAVVGVVVVVFIVKFLI